MNRTDALQLMETHTPSASLRRHMLNVEAAMRWYARHWSEDEELYAMTGLLHDFDYELHPQQHPYWGVEYLKANTDLPEDALIAIMGHATYSGVARETLLAKSLFAVDELTGLVQASALVRPDGDVKGVELSSLKKKFKNRAFAAGVNRDEVEQGARELGVPLEEHMQNVLDAMKGMA